MPRRSRPRREPTPAAGDGHGLRTSDALESGTDGDWIVRALTGSGTTSTYRCPGCDHEIRPATPHLVVWSADDSEAVDRRHWHRTCWRSRARRNPDGAVGERLFVTEHGVQIRGTTILPSRREAMRLRTADGHDLVAELAVPKARPPVATMICVHPLPTQGGMMDSHLFRKAANRLPALAGIAVLRFNTRGTQSEQGRSTGEFSGAVEERFDVISAIEYAEFTELPDPWLVGWSFGTDLVLKYGCDPAICGAILISPPLRYTATDELLPWAESGKPVIALVPEFDDYLRPPAAKERFAAIPQAAVVAVEGAKHLFVGHTERVLDEIVARLNPGAYPLPAYYLPD